MKTFLDQVNVDDLNLTPTEKQLLAVAERYEQGYKELLNCDTFEAQMQMKLRIREILLIDPFARWWMGYKKTHGPQSVGHEAIARLAYNEGRASSKRVAERLADQIFKLYLEVGAEEVSRDEFLKHCKELFDALLKE